VVLALARGPLQAQSATPSATGAEEPIRFGLGPSLPAAQLVREYQPLLTHLSAALGRPVVAVVGANYDVAIQQTVDGTVDLAYLTPAAYVLARQRRPELKLLLSDVRSGLDFYTALLVVRVDDHLEGVEDLRGRRIVYVDRESTSGYVYPMRFLARLGLTPSSFSAQYFSGNHRRSIEMLLKHEADVAAISSSLLWGARDEGMDVSQLVVLARAGVIPQHAVCSTGRLPVEVEERLVEALLAITSLTEEGRRLLPRGLRLNGWRRAVPSEYDDVERMMQGDASEWRP